MEVVTNFTCLLKYPRNFGGSLLIFRLLKWIYGGGQNLPISQNRFTEVGLLRGSSPKMVAIFTYGPHRPLLTWLSPLPVRATHLGRPEKEVTIYIGNET
jgi:hypothetical protein